MILIFVTAHTACGLRFTRVRISRIINDDAVKSIQTTNAGAIRYGQDNVARAVVRDHLRGRYARGQGVRRCAADRHPLYDRIRRANRADADTMKSDPQVIQRR